MGGLGVAVSGLRCSMACGIYIYMASQGAQLVKNLPTCIARDPSSIPGLGRSPGEGKGYPLHYSGLENSMDSIVHGVTKNGTQLSDFLYI